MNKLDRTVRLYHAFQIGIALLVWIPIFYKYQSLHGLSDAQYFMIQSAYYWVVAAIEIPTGYIADRYGHRLSIRLAASTMLVANVTVIFWTSFSGFLIHWLLIALARALTSGAASAYLYDALKRADRATEYKAIEGRARSNTLVARVVAWGLAGYLYLASPSLPYWLTVAACAVATLAAWLMPQFHLSTEDSGGFFADTLKAVRRSGRDLWANPRLPLLMFAGAGLAMLVRISQVNLFQPILEGQGFAVASFGTLMSVMTLIEAAGSRWSHRLEQWGTDLGWLLGMSILIGLSLMLIPLDIQVVTAGAFLVASLAYGFALPIARQLVNDAIHDDGLRATLLSIESIVQRSLTGVAAIFAGLYAAKGEIGSYLIGLALITTAAGLATALISKHFEKSV